MSAPEETFTVDSPIHGLRVWRRIGERRQIHGKPRRLGFWQSNCLVYSRPFTIVTDAAPTDVRFTLITCEEHRLTRAERGRLFRGPDDRRRAAFEKIRAEKLALSSPSPVAR